MRSYYAHLQQTVIQPDKRPIFRSSAIFPVMQQDGLSCRLIFLGYWFLKRHIQELTTVITLRSMNGEVLNRSTLSIIEPKAYTIELKDHLKFAGLPENESFSGSLEVEFHSTKNLIFPYPAVSINYYGPEFSSAVHTAQRVYNDYEDMRTTSQSEVPESGFNIYADDDREPWISLINGAEETPDTHMDMVFFNRDGESIEHRFELGTLAPYETRFLYPAREVDLKAFLKGQVGTVKLRFHLNWIFPRLLIGNLQHSNSAVVVTHSYYDCTEAVSNSDYWLPAEKSWYPASLMLPGHLAGSAYTNLYFYPIYSPSTLFLDIELYNSQGKLLKRVENALTIRSPLEHFERIAVKELLQNEEPDTGIRVIARTPEGERIPARIKLAFDIGQTSEQLPCNICTNLQPFNPELEEKLHSFRWAPILADQKGASAWIMNSSPAIHYKKTAKVHITFYRERDTQTLERDLEIPPHGFIVIRPEQDPELEAFFEKRTGWFTLTTQNPYIVSYYLVEHPSGVVGGDHGY